MIKLNTIKIEGRIIKQGNSYYLCVGRKLIRSNVLNVGQRVTAQIIDVEPEIMKRLLPVMDWQSYLLRKVWLSFKKLSIGGE